MEKENEDLKFSFLQRWEWAEKGHQKLRLKVCYNDAISLILKKFSPGKMLYLWKEGLTLEETKFQPPMEIQNYREFSREATGYTEPWKMDQDKLNSILMLAEVLRTYEAIPKKKYKEMLKKKEALLKKKTEKRCNGIGRY